MLTNWHLNKILEEKIKIKYFSIDIILCGCVCVFVGERERDVVLICILWGVVIVLIGKTHSREDYVEFNLKPPGLSYLGF